MLNKFLKRVYRRFFKSPPKISLDIHKPTEFHGSIYGGWTIISDSLSRDSIVYSVGIGNDITFDISVISKYGCEIFGYDPTPGIDTFLSNSSVPDNFLFRSIGLSSNNGTLKFFKPKVESHVSHQKFSSGNEEELIVPCETLDSIMKREDHSYIDLLKMDIEGFEYEVVEDFIGKGIYPKQLLIEYHHAVCGNDKTEKSIHLLKNAGYKLFYISDNFCEYSFFFDK